VICGVRTFFTGIKAARKRAAPRRCPALPLVPRSGPGGPAMSRWVAPKKIPGLGFRRPTLTDRHSSSLAAHSRLPSRPSEPGWAGVRVALVGQARGTLRPAQAVSASTNPYQRSEGTVCPLFIGPQLSDFPIGRVKGATTLTDELLDERLNSGTTPGPFSTKQSRPSAGP